MLTVVYTQLYTLNSAMVFVKCSYLKRHVKMFLIVVMPPVVCLHAQMCQIEYIEMYAVYVATTTQYNYFVWQGVGDDHSLSTNFIFSLCFSVKMYHGVA